MLTNNLRAFRMMALQPIDVLAAGQRNSKPLNDTPLTTNHDSNLHDALNRNSHGKHQDLRRCSMKLSATLLAAEQAKWAKHSTH